MGGQETLLLLARFPGLLAGAAAFDAPTNMAARYRAFDRLPYGDHRTWNLGLCSTLSPRATELNETTNGGKRWKRSAGQEQAGRREELEERIALTEHRCSDELAAHEAQHVAVS